MAFFEAYFSNYIEGTMFEIGEARDIIFENKIPDSRPSDAHDIIARIMMNAELVKCGLSKIIVPTVYREDYLLALRSLSRSKRVTPFIRMMSKAQEFSAGIDFLTFDVALKFLEGCNAFEEHREAKLKFPRAE